jgi:hypothetical protein
MEFGNFWRTRDVVALVTTQTIPLTDKGFDKGGQGER